MLRFATNPSITITPSVNNNTTASNTVIRNDQIAMISSLVSYTGESQEKCLRYLIFFGWNFELAFKATMVWCQELCERTKMSNMFFARRILEEAQFDIVLCQQRMEFVLHLMSRTNLVHVFAYDCLQQYQWNFNNALQRVFELASMNQLPAQAFSTLPNLQVQTNNVNSSDAARSLHSLQNNYHSQSRRNLFSM